MSKYYYYDGRQNVGPMPLEELRARSISADTLVWYEGLPDWKKASELPELADKFAAAQPAAAAPGAQPQQQMPQQQNPYAHLNNPAPYYQQQNYSGGGSAPNMGVLKVFSIIGIVLSIILFVLGAGVMDLHASGCWSCDCYPYVSGNEELATGIFILSILFLTFSIIAMVKAFKRYT